MFIEYRTKTNLAIIIGLSGLGRMKEHFDIADMLIKDFKNRGYKFEGKFTPIQHAIQIAIIQQAELEKENAPLAENLANAIGEFINQKGEFASALQMRETL